MHRFETLQTVDEVSYGGHFLFLADEVYIKAGIPFPPLASYGDLPQLENGVGMVALFRDQWKKMREKQTGRRKRDLGPYRRVVAVTGELAYPAVLEYFVWLRDTVQAPLELVPIKNRFLGSKVTVAGLVAGRDVLRNLEGQVGAGEAVLVPDVMLDFGGGRFLDDLTPACLEHRLGAKVIAFRADPEGFEEALGLRTSFSPKRLVD